MHACMLLNVSAPCTFPIHLTHTVHRSKEILDAIRAVFLSSHSHFKSKLQKQSTKRSQPFKHSPASCQPDMPYKLSAPIPTHLHLDLAFSAPAQASSTLLNSPLACLGSGLLVRSALRLAAPQRRGCARGGGCT
eukprot:1157626-Pelagomonas_calceolata.AAC.5